MGRGAALQTRSGQRLPQGACGFPGNIPPPGNWPGCDNVQGAAEAASSCDRRRIKSSRLKPLLPEQPVAVPGAEQAPLALAQIAQRQTADAAAMQRLDVVADRGEHPPHLVV